MGLPASGPISSSQVGDYLGDSPPYKLGEMADTAGFSAPDKLSDFYGYQTQSDYGEYYYYNVDTGEQSWDIPEALGGDKVPTWVKVYDPASISYYYYNNF